MSDESRIYWDETLEGPFGVDSARIIDEDEGGVIAYCHVDSADRIVEALSKLGQSEGGVIEVKGDLTVDDLAKQSGERHLPRNEHGFYIYPAGTPITEVREFDRGQKVVFQCKDHPLSIWASKDPYCSRWFPARREYEECDCKLTNYVLAEDYSPTRNG
jgi:hypothetical protein